MVKNRYGRETKVTFTLGVFPDLKRMLTELSAQWPLKFRQKKIQRPGLTVKYEDPIYFFLDFD